MSNFVEHIVALYKTPVAPTSKIMLHALLHSCSAQHGRTKNYNPRHSSHFREWVVKCGSNSRFKSTLFQAHSLRSLILKPYFGLKLFISHSKRWTHWWNLHRKLFAASEKAEPMNMHCCAGAMSMRRLHGMSQQCQKWWHLSMMPAESRGLNWSKYRRPCEA